MASDSVFKFMVSTNLRFGPGESEKLASELKSLGFSRVATVVDRGVFDHPQVKKSLEMVRKAGIDIDVYKSEAVEPTYDYLESFKENFKNKIYDCLIGIGGGSALDLTKGIAVLLANEGPAISFRGFPKLKNKPLPVIAIPTTAGTGSEATYNAVFIDSKENKKLGINSTLNFPVCAIIDPLILAGCPRSAAVSAGADALVHTLESYCHRKSTPLSRIYSKEAFHLIFNNLTRALDDPGDIDSNGKVALGAYLAGIALINAGSGFAGAFSYPLGVMYKVPHGFAGAVFLTSVLKFNIDRGYSDYAELHDLMEGADTSIPVKEKNVLLLKSIVALFEKIGIPKSLSFYGLKQKDIDILIGQYDSLKAGIGQNPVEITKDDASSMINNLV